MSKIQVLTIQEIDQKIKRIAYEILEDNYGEKEITLVGIKDGGYMVAEKLHSILKSISKLKITLSYIKLNKEIPNTEDTELGVSQKQVDKKVVILVDDVTNSGRTITYALKPFLDLLPKKLQTVVLVDRKHKRFPVSADYVGLLLSTTMQDHISVELKDIEKAGAFLN